MTLKNVIKQIKKAVYSKLPMCSIYPRKFHAYCVGTAKSGTHSIAEMFSLNYRASHEPEGKLMIDMILAASNGSITKIEQTEFVKKRDKRLWLEMESSQLTYFFIDILVENFVNAKFILTIRDCYSWLDSLINHQLSLPVSQNWLKLRNFRFKADEFKHTKEEKILAENGLYTLDGYLSYWATHNKNVLATVPENRLLVIRTHEITQNISRIAEFLGIHTKYLDVSKSHSFKSKKNYGLLSRIDRKFLEEKVDTHCKEIMDKYFPDIK